MVAELAENSLVENKEQLWEKKDNTWTKSHILECRHMIRLSFYCGKYNKSLVDDKFRFNLNIILLPPIQTCCIFN